MCDSSYPNSRGRIWRNATTKRRRDARISKVNCGHGRPNPVRLTARRRLREALAHLQARYQAERTNRPDPCLYLFTELMLLHLLRAKTTSDTDASSVRLEDLTRT
jgi:hypothetical protein